MEQRITTLKEISQFSIAASRALNESLRRQETKRDLDSAMQWSDEAVQALLKLFPVTSTELLSLDSVEDALDSAEMLLAQSNG